MIVSVIRYASWWRFVRFSDYKPVLLPSVADWKNTLAKPVEHRPKLSKQHCRGGLWCCPGGHQTCRGFGSYPPFIISVPQAAWMFYLSTTTSNSTDLGMWRQRRQVMVERMNLRDHYWAGLQLGDGAGWHVLTLPRKTSFQQKRPIGLFACDALIGKVLDTGL